MNLPTGRRLKTDDRPPNHVGSIGDGLDVTAEALEVAKSSWPQARAEDFERVGRRRWRDRASGVEYRRAHGCPLLGAGGPVEAGISTFFVSGSRFYFLVPADEPQGASRSLGSVGSWQPGAHEPAGVIGDGPRVY